MKAILTTNGCIQIISSNTTLQNDCDKENEKSKEFRLLKGSNHPSLKSSIQHVINVNLQENLINEEFDRYFKDIFLANSCQVRVFV